jgi:hypothetical protein
VEQASRRKQTWDLGHNLIFNLRQSSVSPQIRRDAEFNRRDACSTTSKITLRAIARRFVSQESFRNEKSGSVKELAQFADLRFAQFEF